MQLHAEYATELARQLVYDIFKDDAYTRGLNVYLTINSNDQKAAYNAVRANIIRLTALTATAAPRPR